MSDEGQRDQSQQPLPCSSNQMDVDALLQLLSGQVGLASIIQQRSMPQERCFISDDVATNKFCTSAWPV
jgi:hypothetical protein